MSYTPSCLYKTSFYAALIAAFYSSWAAAANVGGVDLTVGGFGNFGMVHSSESQADFTSSIFKPNGAGYSHAWSADVDSRLGLQVAADLTPRLSAVVQVIAEQNYDNTYRPRVEWANIKYQLTPNFSVRAGRTLEYTFLLSDTRNVAYSYPWVRPPLEVYRQAPVTASDGVDASYQLHVGDFTNVLQAHFGKSESKLPGSGGTVAGKRSWGLAYAIEYHAALVHIGYEATHITLDGTRPIFDAFRQFGPEGIAIAEKYDADNKPYSVITIGARYDPGQWFVMAEAAHSVSHSFFGEATSWYLSGGHRFGKVTPYLTYGQARTDNLYDAGLNLSTLPPPLIGPAGGLNAALNSLLSTKLAQNTLSVGGRWDALKNVDFKLQYDRTRIDAGSTGALVGLQPGFQPGSTYYLINAAVDFVF